MHLIHLQYFKERSQQPVTYSFYLIQAVFHKKNSHITSKTWKHSSSIASNFALCSVLTMPMSCPQSSLHYFQDCPKQQFTHGNALPTFLGTVFEAKSPNKPLYSMIFKQRLHSFFFFLQCISKTCHNLLFCLSGEMS